MSVPIWIFEGFQQKEILRLQNLNNGTFRSLPVISAQCKLSTGNYPDAGILLIYNDDDYSQGNGQYEETFRPLTKDDILEP